MSSRGNLTLVSSRTHADRWTISVDLTANALEIRNDLRRSLLVVTQAGKGTSRPLGSYDRPALVRALAEAVRLQPSLGFDLALAARLGAQASRPEPAEGAGRAGSQRAPAGPA